MQYQEFDKTVTKVPPLLEIKGLSVNRSGKQVLYNIDLSMMKGEFVGLVGPNGGGKSTLLLAIIGIL